MKLSITVATAVLTVLCPLGYSGNAGVWISGVQEESMRARIAVSGRMYSYLNFDSQQAMKASCMTELAFAKPAADSIRLRFLPRAILPKMASQCPAGEIFSL